MTDLTTLVGDDRLSIGFATHCFPDNWKSGVEQKIPGLFHARAGKKVSTKLAEFIIAELIYTVTVTHNLGIL